MTISATACAASMAACACALAANAPEAEARAPQSAVSPSASCYLNRPDVLDFLSEVSEKHKIPLDWLKDEVAVARYSETAERLMTPKPGVKKPGSDIVKPPFRNFVTYARNFLSQERILRGREFIERNSAVFDEVELKSGVSRYVITAIIGVETFYGRNMGRYRVLDSLMTLSFDYTRRAAYFKEELAHFLEFCWREQVQPVTVLGSFAGAVGYGQFMPSSLDRWGADGDDDGRIDLVESEPDAIASVARFLTAHGWVAGRGLLYPVKADAEIFDATGSGGIAAHATVAGLREAGVDTGGHFPLLDDEPVLLVDLPQLDEKGQRTTKWYIGTRNFSSVLRYNRSYFYAAAVTMLANRIAGISEP